jgi:hypothetical protein
MEQYILKSALVAELERLVNNQDSALDYEAALEDVRNFLETIEVKKVDLDYIKDELDKVIKIYKPDWHFGWGTLYNIAIHFFELGRSVSNKAQKGE